MGKIKGCLLGLMHSKRLQFNKWNSFFATGKAPALPGRFV